MTFSSSGPWSAACFTVALLGCSASTPKHKALGVMPSANTKAVPEWLPERVRAGVAVESDPRETHLFDVRRVTDGWNVRQVGWTPDGSSLIVAGLRPGESEPALYMLRASASDAATRISRPGDGVISFAVRGTRASWRVVYAASSASKASELVEIAPGGQSPGGTGSAARPIDVHGLDVQAVADGPEGGLFLLAKDGGAVKIFRADKDGGTPKAIVSDDVAPIAPALSPDRAYVAFGRKGRALGAGALGYSSVEGRSDAELATVAGYALRNVTFHPSGRWVAFASDRDRESFDLYAVELDGSLSARAKGEGRVVRLTFGQADAPAFSADGRNLAFTSTRRGSSPDLYVARFLEEP